MRALGPLLVMLALTACATVPATTDNLDAIAFRQDDTRVAAARHDLAIALDRDALAGIAEQFD